jgi:hypothetical protein
MEELYQLLDALANYVRSPLQHLTFQPGLNWWMLSPMEGLRDQVKDYLHLFVQLGHTTNPEFLIKVKLSSLIENQFGDEFLVLVYTNKRFVTVVCFAREEQAEFPLAATIVHEKNCDEKNKKWTELKKSITSAAKKTLIQEKALSFLARQKFEREQKQLQQHTCLLRAHQSSEQPLRRLKQQAP